MKRILGIVFCLVVVCAGGVGWLAWRGMRSLDEPLRVGAPVIYRVPVGARFARVSAELGQRGIVAQPRVWAWYARWTGAANLIRAGEYEIEPGATARSLLEKMVSGQVLLHSLTIVDGWRVTDLLQTMRRNPDIATTLPERPEGLMRSLGFGDLSSEGQFLPETYRFPSGTRDVELLRQAHGALLRVLGAAWANRDPTLPLHSADEFAHHGLHRREGKRAARRTAENRRLVPPPPEHRHAAAGGSDRHLRTGRCL